MKALYRNRRSGALLVFLLAVICYANTFGNEFVFDDLEIIPANPLVTGEGVSGGRAGTIFASHYWQHVSAGGNLYRPLTIATYALNHALGGLEPAGYHLVNLLLHGLVSLLVFSVAQRLGFALSLATAAGILFATHPIHTEAVTGVVGRAELLAASGVMGGWMIHLSGRPGVVRPILVGLCLMAALLSKENGIVLPALILAGDLYRARTGRTEWRSTLLTLVACLVAVATWFLLRAIVLPDVEAPLVSVFSGETVVTRIATSLTVLARYLWLLVFPLHLSADYSFAQIDPVDSLTALPALGSGLIFSLLTLGSGWAILTKAPLREESRQVGLGFMVFLLALAPVSNIFVSIGTIMGERLLYLPSVGWCLALPALWKLLCLAAGNGPALRRAGGAMLVLLAALYGLRTLDRNTDWKDQLTLFSRTVETSPKSAKAWFNLGVSLEKAGRPEEALAAYEAAIRIRSDHAKAHHNAGLLLAGRGALQMAAEHLEAAASSDPNLPDLQSSLGVVYTRLHRPEEAERAFILMLEREPHHHDAHYNLGTLQLMRSAPEEALPHLEAAVATDGDDPDARYQLGLAYLAVGRPVESIGQQEEALRILPSLSEAHLQIALARLEMGQREEAASSARRARDAGLPLPAELVDLLE